VFIENLDLVRLGRMGGDPQRAAGWLIDKYSDWSFDAIIPTSAVIRDFVLANRSRLSPGARIVALERPGEALPPGDSPHDYQVVTTESVVSQTINLACQLFPHCARIALVGQTLPHPRLLEAHQTAVRQGAEERGLEYLSLIDLPLIQLRARLRELPLDSVVIYQGYWKDELGKTYVPAEILTSLCGETRAPVFGLVDAHVGRGIVGGACADMRGMGEAAGRLLVAGRGGPGPAAAVIPPILLFDERVLNRFGIRTSQLPVGSRVLFREAKLWQRYWPQLAAGTALLALETLLILALVTQSRRRRHAERIVSEQRDQIAHAGRVSTLGQLAASLAHELGQPLGAILNNIEAAEILLRGDESPNAGELRANVADIAADDERAGAVLDRIRAMVRKQPFTVGPVDVPGLIRGVLALAGSRLADDGIDVTVACDPGIPRVAGDEILLQQALLNLVGNSAEAIRTLGATSAAVKATGGSQREPGAISIRARRDGNSVVLAVIDNGGGIRDAGVDTALQPFETTKEHGLGMGLPIVGSIVERHEGTMRIQNDPGRGVEVAIRLPAWH
jgi:hypothetical protein